MADLLPSKEILIECMDLASTPEAAAYLSQQFEALLTRRNLQGKFQPLVAKFQAYADEVMLSAESATNPWRGERPLSDYANISVQRALTVEKDKPVAPIENVAIGIDFGDTEELNRGYMVNNQPADAEDTARLDVSFHAWFARNGLLFRSPFIYQATEAGEIKTSADGQPLRVKLDEFKQAVEAENSGLKSYFNKHVNGVSVEFVQVKLPAKTPAPDADVAPAA
tara:strand:+ start:8545 stop:9216 length:672 start_codon:yes stop_codon:yes gene_type:complete